MDLSKHLENAAEAVKRRNYPFAIKVYGQLLAIQPDNQDARAGLRKALFQKVAQKPASRLTAMLGGGVNLLIGAVQRLCGAHGGAAKSFERYLAMDPLHEGANLKLGDSLLRAGCARGALAVFQAYAEQQPRCLLAARSAGALLYQQGKLNEALAMYEQALKVDPRDQESLKARKDLAAEGALRSSGIETAQSSRELIKDKEQQRQLERQERMQLSADEVESELERLEAELQQNATDGKLLRRVARLREMAKDMQGALDCLEQALRQEPGDSDLQDQAGDLRLRLQQQMVTKAERSGDEAAAARARAALAESRAAEYRRRVQRNPADLPSRFLLGQALLDCGEVDPAIAELQQAVKEPRKRAEAQFLLGRAFQGKQLPELALGQFEKAHQGAGTGPLAMDALYEMGVLSLQLGKRDIALKHFSTLLEQDIGFRDVAQRVQELKAS